MVVTDTHALLGYAEGRSGRLGRVARRLFEEAEEGRTGVYVSVVSPVEVMEAHERGRLQLSVEFDAWTEALFAGTGFFAAEITLAVVRRARSLAGIPERGDRLIAATVAELGLSLLTRDPEIARRGGVRTVW